MQWLFTNFQCAQMTITFQLPVALLHLNSSFSAFVFIYLIALILRQVKDVNILSIESMPSD